MRDRVSKILYKFSHDLLLILYIVKGINSGFLLAVSQQMQLVRICR